MSENTPDPYAYMAELPDGLSETEKAEFGQQLIEKKLQLERSSGADTLERARLKLDIAELLVLLERKEEAWNLAREAFDTALKNESWQDAVEACNVLYQTEQAASIPALGMGVWLAVTFPVTPELTYAMLDHVVTETPNNSDGAALAAVTTRYVIDLRANDEEHGDWSLLADNLIARVAERHSKVQDQKALDAWMDKLGLRDPQVFLPRLSQVVNAIVGDAWWFDRDELRDKLPD
ncbi:hypothetical protein SCD_n02609 [Sulfuricella denitrificans skB26]|uniref:Uncharacterized protein n=1 Tax=Sulfuricella denitrificans (strain DSM 22764 / NBRC 105220 / skB26) TaxID=1163617 RepID=S6AB00_SULDS|nr:hypothetical protein [Sulfuricella denitrificans]BAN36410.1 hypothetical protein SCD_n02609 [Sulfuricella denitrificans skB26]